MDIIEKMKKEMFRRKLSPKTIKTYLFYVKKFLLFCPKQPKEFSKKDCREFLEKFMDKELKWMKKNNDEIAGSTLNVALNSLRFMMEEVLRKSMKLNIKYSKKPKALPTCLSKNEVKKIINLITNSKHKLLISLIYGAGLRVSEAVKLKKMDIELEENIGWVRKGKGNKDRPFILPECLKEDIKLIIKSNTTDYLFPGRKAHLSVRSVQMILKKAAKKSKIKKNIHPHTLNGIVLLHMF
ncbi:MAG: site-specific integrase [Nanoarchaeota archaeon]|nr:site-specific integrase [Nanoarchaeota archaeon]MBU4352648.1 site-specific integrase [Nanoarchaeota archaeon]